MKKRYISFFLFAALSLLLTACSSDLPTPNQPTTDNITPTTSEVLPLPQDSLELSFRSGVGAWDTVLTLNRDGTFVGQFRDADMGDIGEGYPNGTEYTCTFSGKFVNIQKKDEYSYEMTLSNVETKKAVGEEWIEDGVRYVADKPYGLTDSEDGQESTQFVFYLPNTPIDRLPTEFLTWWPDDLQANTTLSCYAILNVATNYGFFSAE